MRTKEYSDVLCIGFQSPRSGQICSNLTRDELLLNGGKFQSPRSGQICSNASIDEPQEDGSILKFQSPRSGQIYSNSLKDYSRKNKN